MKYVTAFFLYILFSAASFFAGVIGVVVGLPLLAFGHNYLGNVMHSMDMLLAALLGWDGRSTVSKECGKSSCRFCRALCWVLHYVLEENHCEKEARE